MAVFLQLRPSGGGGRVSKGKLVYLYQAAVTKTAIESGPKDRPSIEMLEVEQGGKRLDNEEKFRQKVNRKKWPEGPPKISLSSIPSVL